MKKPLNLKRKTFIFFLLVLVFCGNSCRRDNMEPTPVNYVGASLQTLPESAKVHTNEINNWFAAYPQIKPSPQLLSMAQQAVINGKHVVRMPIANNTAFYFTKENDSLKVFAYKWLNVKPGEKTFTGLIDVYSFQLDRLRRLKYGDGKLLKTLLPRYNTTGNLSLSNPTNSSKLQKSTTSIPNVPVVSDIWGRIWCWLHGGTYVADAYLANDDDGFYTVDICYLGGSDGVGGPTGSGGGTGGDGSPSGSPSTGGDPGFGGAPSGGAPSGGGPGSGGSPGGGGDPGNGSSPSGSTPGGGGNGGGSSWVMPPDNPCGSGSTNYPTDGSGIGTDPSQAPIASLPTDGCSTGGGPNGYVPYPIGGISIDPAITDPNFVYANYVDINTIDNNLDDVVELLNYTKDDTEDNLNYTFDPTTDVEFVDVKLDATFSSNSQLNSIYTKLKTQHTFNKLIAKFFGKNNPVNIEFRANDIFSSDRANTYPIGDKQNPYSDRIIINIDPTKAAMRPDLMVAKTIIHEVIHAEIWRIIHLGQLGILPNEYDKILNALLAYSKAYPASNPKILNNVWDHGYMAKHFLSTIAKGLQEFDNNTNTPLCFYKMMAWEGLIGTPYWYKMKQSDRSYIQSSIDSYINSQNISPCLN